MRCHHDDKTEPLTKDHKDILEKIPFILYIIYKQDDYGEFKVSGMYKEVTATYPTDKPWQHNTAVDRHYIVIDGMVTQSLLLQFL